MVTEGENQTSEQWGADRSAGRRVRIQGREQLLEQTLQEGGMHPCKLLK